MAKATAIPKLGVTVTFEIDEEEARALEAMAGYGEETFIKAFYTNLGEAYMKRHEAGLRRFLASIRDVVNPALGRIDQARLLLKERDKERSTKAEE